MPIAADGSGLSFWPIAADLEGLCVANPASDYLYVGTEQPNQVKEFQISTGTVTRTFDLNPWMTGAAGQGLEALTFVPDSGNAEGGTFYAGLQEDGTIYRFSLPIVTSATKSRRVRTFPSPRTPEISFATHPSPQSLSPQSSRLPSSPVALRSSVADDADGTAG